MSGALSTREVMRSVLPASGPERPMGYVPTSEDDAVRFMAPYAWVAFKRMKLTWVGARAADLTQAFLLGVVMSYRGKWDPKRGTFWIAAMYQGMHYMRNEMTILNSRRCVDSAYNAGVTAEEWMPAFQIGAFAETRVAALEVLRDLTRLAQTPAEIEVVRALVQQEAPDHKAVGVSSQRMHQVKETLLRRLRLGQASNVKDKRPPPPPRTAGPRRDGMTIPEHVAAGKPHWQIAARFGLTLEGVRDRLKAFRQTVAKKAPGLRPPPRGPTTAATLQWYRDALGLCGSACEEANAE